MSLAPVRCASISSMETSRIIGASASSTAVASAPSPIFQSKIDIFAEFFLQDVGCFIGRSVVFDQRFANFWGLVHTSSNSRCRRKLEAVDRIDVEWITDRHYQAGLAESDRDHLKRRAFSPRI
jgi:hypothetical protein